MKVDLKKLEQVLSKAKIIYLSTCIGDRVSARPVSPLNIGLRLYVRTSAASRKAKEMLANPNVAVCAGDFYFTGKAKPLGSAFDDGNAEIKSAYAVRYPESFSAEDGFIKTDEQFFEIIIGKVSQWIYEKGIPVGLAEQDVSDENERKAQ